MLLCKSINTATIESRCFHVWNKMADIEQVFRDEDDTEYFGESDDDNEV